MGGQNLPSPQVGIGLTDRPKMGGGAVGSGIPVFIAMNPLKRFLKVNMPLGKIFISKYIQERFFVYFHGAQTLYTKGAYHDMEKQPLHESTCVKEYM